MSTKRAKFFCFFFFKKRSVCSLPSPRDRAGIELGVLGSSNATLARLCTRYPDRFIGLSATSPLDGMTGVRNFERLVRDHNIGGLRVVALYNGIPASDRRYYPLYTKCCERDLPFRVYIAMTYATTRLGTLLAGYPILIRPGPGTAYIVDALLLAR